MPRIISSADKDTRPKKNEMGDRLCEGSCANVNTLPSETSADAKKLYDSILKTSNTFLYNCKYFAMPVLQEEDPSYAEMARHMKKVATIIHIVADEFDPMMCHKAFEYCELMTAMGVAVDSGDKLLLSRLVAELERKPGI